MKKIFRIMFITVLLLWSAALYCSGVSISAQSAVVLDARTNEVVFESNAHEKRSMASTTKIMTAILAVESGRLGECVHVTAAMSGAEGTSIGLRPGYKLSLFDLVCGMMLESGNDAANAVALHLSGSFEKFSELMNQKAAELGMNNTCFVTPSGLDDENHYSTAYDMAILASYCIRNPVFRSVCSDKSHVAELISPASGRLYFSNHNRLLSSVEGVFGVKTGFTKKSGRCLVSAVEKDGIVLVAVTLKAPDDWNDHKKLFSHCFEQYESCEADLDFPKSLSVEGGVRSIVSVIAEKDSITVAARKGQQIEKRVFFPGFIYAPVRKGQVVGRVEYYSGGKMIDSVLLYAGEGVSPQKETYIQEKTFLERLAEKFRRLFA